jgi:hypothetical protein
MNQSEVTMAESFLEKVKSGDVTHGFLCYRDKMGELKYQLYSPEHATYILGMIERAKFAMCE